MKRLFLSSILFCLSNSLWAYFSPHGNWYANGNVGVTFSRVDDHNFLNSGPGWPRDLYRNNSIDSVALIGIGGGYTWATSGNWVPFYSLGASYTYVFPANVTGEVLQYSLPQFTNYNYQYKIQRQTFLAVAKADIYCWRRLMPFIILGAGWSINNISNYDENSTPNVTPRVDPSFKGKTNSYLSYTIGAGLDFIVRNDLWMSLEYNYGYFGHARTGPGVNIPGADYSNTNLKTKLSSNTIMLGVTFFG